MKMSLFYLVFIALFLPGCESEDLYDHDAKPFYFSNHSDSRRDISLDFLSDILKKSSIVRIADWNNDGIDDLFIFNLSSIPTKKNQKIIFELDFHISLGFRDTSNFLNFKTSNLIKTLKIPFSVSELEKNQIDQGDLPEILKKNITILLSDFDHNLTIDILLWIPLDPKIMNFSQIFLWFQNKEKLSSYPDITNSDILANTQPLDNKYVSLIQFTHYLSKLVNEHHSQEGGAEPLQSHELHLINFHLLDWNLKKHDTNKSCNFFSLWHSEEDHLIIQCYLSRYQPYLYFDQSSYIQPVSRSLKKKYFLKKRFKLSNVLVGHFSNSTHLDFLFYQADRNSQNFTFKALQLKPVEENETSFFPFHIKSTPIKSQEAIWKLQRTFPTFQPETHGLHALDANMDGYHDLAMFHYAEDKPIFSLWINTTPLYHYFQSQPSSFINHFIK
jgi:hypothetical protein